MEAGKSEHQIQFMLSPSKYETPAKSASGVSKYVIYFHPLDLREKKKTERKGDFLRLIEQAKILPFLLWRRKYSTKPIYRPSRNGSARSRVKCSQE